MISLISTLDWINSTDQDKFIAIKLEHQLKTTNLFMMKKIKGLLVELELVLTKNIILLQHRITQHLKSISSVYPRKVQNLNYLKRGKRK